MTNQWIPPPRIHSITWSVKPIIAFALAARPQFNWSCCQISLGPINARYAVIRIMLFESRMPWYCNTCLVISMEGLPWGSKNDSNRDSIVGLAREDYWGAIGWRLHAWLLSSFVRIEISWIRIRVRVQRDALTTNELSMIIGDLC